MNSFTGIIAQKNEHIIHPIDPVQIPSVELAKNTVTTAGANTPLPRLKRSALFSLFYDRELRLHELPRESFKLLLWIVLNYSLQKGKHDSGLVRFTIRKACAETHISRATIHRVLNILKARNLISHVEMNYRVGNLWKIQKELIDIFYL